MFINMWISTRRKKRVNKSEVIKSYQHSYQHMFLITFLARNTRVFQNFPVTNGMYLTISFVINVVTKYTNKVIIRSTIMLLP